MKIGDIVEYTDQRGEKHDARVTRVMKQPTNIERTAYTELINVEYSVRERIRIAELISENPNASGQCYGKVLKGEKDAEPDLSEASEAEDNTTPDERTPDDEEPKKQEDSEDPDGDTGPEASSEADDEPESESGSSEKS